MVVAAGSFNAPSMPSIPGLKEWVERFPELILHSSQFRQAEAYANQTVLIIGASVRYRLKSFVTHKDYLK